jgi:hypothetical protein
VNPLNWKREHQLAMAVAAAIGCVAGLMVAYFLYDPRPGYSPFWTFSNGVNWRYVSGIIGVVGWALLSTIIGAAVVYVRQLLRR